MVKSYNRNGLVLAMIDTKPCILWPVQPDYSHLIVSPVHAIGEGSSGRLVDHPEHVESGNVAGILGGLPLGVVEVLKD